RSRINDALDRREEMPSVDFKQSAPWSDLRVKIVRTMLGMGNLRDGGLIIIGVAQSGESWELTGINDEHRRTYNPDVMADFVAKYVSPHCDFSAIQHAYEGQQYIVIHMKPFAAIPLVCKRSLGADLKTGGIYVRPLEGRPRTTLVQHAAQTHELLEMAAEERAREILQQAKRIGLLPGEYEPEASDVEDARKFANELEDL
ncbi:MAG: ATP-binding protein, partial [Haliea sp.]